jgi:hypothetical protein
MANLKIHAVVCWDVLVGWTNLPARGCYGFPDKTTAVEWIANVIRQAAPTRTYHSGTIDETTWRSSPELLDFVQNQVLREGQFIRVFEIDRVYQPEVVNNTVGDYLEQLGK